MHVKCTIHKSNQEHMTLVHGIGRPTMLARSGTHASAYLLYNYPKVGNFIRDYQSNKNTYIQNFDRN